MKILFSFKFVPERISHFMLHETRNIPTRNKTRNKTRNTTNQAISVYDVLPEKKPVLAVDVGKLAPPFRSHPMAPAVVI